MSVLKGQGPGGVKLNGLMLQIDMFDGAGDAEQQEQQHQDDNFMSIGTGNTGDLSAALMSLAEATEPGQDATVESISSVAVETSVNLYFAGSFAGEVFLCLALDFFEPTEMAIVQGSAPTSSSPLPNAVATPADPFAIGASGDLPSWEEMQIIKAQKM